MVSFRIILSLLISLSIAGQGTCLHDQEHQVFKRDNTVYVTVTEYRYVPIPPPATLMQSPAFLQPASALAEHPAQPLSIATPAATAWLTNSNAALTYTSYAGLLSTVAPAFYPSPSLAVALPVPAIPIPTTASLAAPSSQTLSSISVAVWTPVPVWVTTHHSSVSATAPASSSTLVAPSFNSQPTSTSSGSTQSDSKSLSASEVSPSTSLSTTSASADVTVSTSTTTRVDSVTTSTFVGSDGTTTAMTEYPSSTRPHGAQSTSGADSRRPLLRLDGHTLASVFISPGSVWVAIAAALTMPGVLLLVI